MSNNSRPIRIKVFGKTDVGRNRDHNEDSFLVADLSQGNASLQPEVRDHDLGPKGTLLMVADGMGGAAAGEVASDMAIKNVYDHMIKEWGADAEHTPQKFAQRLKEAVEKTNQTIHSFAREHPEHRGMLEWVGGEFDPEAFDVEEVNRALKRVK